MRVGCARASGWAPAWEWCRCGRSRPVGDTPQVRPCRLGGGHPWPPTVPQLRPHPHTASTPARCREPNNSLALFTIWWWTRHKSKFTATFRAGWRGGAGRNVGGHGWPPSSAHGCARSVSGQRLPVAPPAYEAPTHAPAYEAPTHSPAHEAPTNPPARQLPITLASNTPLTSGTPQTASPQPAHSAPRKSPNPTPSAYPPGQSPRRPKAAPTRSTGGPAFRTGPEWAV